MPTSPLKTKYRDDLILFRDRWEFVGLALAIFTIIAFPFLANDHWLSLGVDVWIMIVGAVSMMVLTGFAGQVSLGHAAFLAVGAYATAICSLSFGMPLASTSNRDGALHDSRRHHRTPSRFALKAFIWPL